ncbi:MAG: serine/threonine-protein kinase, partial [Planctomycetota bacterium]
MSADSIENAETVAAPLSELPSANGTLQKKTTAANGSASRSSSALGAAARGFVNLVEGSTPHLSTETSDVLRRRLVMAGGLFFAGFAAFWLRGFVFEMPAYTFSDASHSEFVASEQRLVEWTHIVAMLVVGAVAAWLYRARDASLTTLRLAEYTIFGSVAIFFTLITHIRFEIDPWLSEGAHLPAIATPWMLLIFTYALFIPNSWRRSLRFLLPATALPIALILVQKNICPGFQRCLTHQISGSYVSEQALVLLLTFATAVVGVATINSLRRQAFEAKQLGQYRLKQKIGVGGMGEVYLAEHRMMKRPCAVKVIRPEKAGDPRIMARFEREVRTTAKLSHWNSIDIYDYGRTEDGTFYYVMEFLPGHNTGELVDQEGPLPPQRVIYLMDQVCRALSEAHAIGLVHRDIKPANIFCAARGGEF